MLLSRLTLRVNNDSINDAMIFDCTEAYPYRVSDIRMPTDKTEFVYFLVSVCDVDKDYIGQTKCLAGRLQEHNAGMDQHPSVIHFSGHTMWLHLLLDLVCYTDAGKRSLRKDGSTTDIMLS